MLFFKNVFPADQAVGALLIWRFFTYYFTMITGFGAVLADGAANMRRIKKVKIHIPEEIEQKGEAADAAENSKTSGSSDRPEENDQ